MSGTCADWHVTSATRLVARLRRPTGLRPGKMSERTRCGVLARVVPGERDHDHAVIFREQCVRTPVVSEMPTAHREVSAVCGRQPIPGGPATLALQTRDRRVVRPPIRLVQRGGDTDDRVDHETECATPCARQAGWSCAPIAISCSASSPERCGSLTTLSSSTTSSRPTRNDTRARSCLVAIPSDTRRHSVFQSFPESRRCGCDPSDGRAGQRIQRRLQIVH